MSDRPPLPEVRSNMTAEGEFNKYTTSNPIERYLVDNFTDTLTMVLPPIDPARVLEVGVGEGHVSEQVANRYPDAALAGLDLPHDDLAERWGRRGVLGVFGDAHRLPFEDDAFDLVLCIEVLEHLPEPERALQEISRVGSGLVVLSVPLEPLWRIGNMARGRYLSDWGNTPDHIQHWTRRGFTRMVGRHLDVVTVRNPLPWTLVVARTPRGAAT